MQVVVDDILVGLISHMCVLSASFSSFFGPVYRIFAPVLSFSRVVMIAVYLTW
jgi:hypothetical protein